jgi:hypothetical protein
MDVDDTGTSSSGTKVVLPADLHFKKSLPSELVLDSGSNVTIVKKVCLPFTIVLSSGSIYS